jgi:hypothetical protein
MPSKDPSPAEALRAVPSPLPVGRISTWERAVLGLDDEAPGEDGQPDSSLAGADREHEVWPFGVASQVFLKAKALSAALGAAQQAHIVASRCCMDCVAWTLSLQAQAHHALGQELTMKARRLRAPQPIRPVFEEEAW